MASDPIVVVSAARTPIGGLLGDFAGRASWEHGAVAIKAAVERADVPADRSSGAVTLSKMCGSGMRAMRFAHDMLAAGSTNAMVAGGMESMTSAPQLTFARKGVKYGAAQLPRGPG